MEEHRPPQAQESEANIAHRPSHGGAASRRSVPHGGGPRRPARPRACSRPDRRRPCRRRRRRPPLVRAGPSWQPRYCSKARSVQNEGFASRARPVLGMPVGVSSPCASLPRPPARPHRPHQAGLARAEARVVTSRSGTGRFWRCSAGFQRRFPLLSRPLILAATGGGQWRCARALRGADGRRGARGAPRPAPPRPAPPRPAPPRPAPPPGRGGRSGHAGQDVQRCWSLVRVRACVTHQS